MSTIIRDLKQISNPTFIIQDQVAGFLGAHAVMALEISAGLNPLAAGASYAVSNTAWRIIYYIIPEMKFQGINANQVLAAVGSLVAGAKMYAATSALSNRDLMKINAIILATSLVFNAGLDLAAGGAKIN